MQNTTKCVLHNICSNDYFCAEVKNISNSRTLVLCITSRTIIIIIIITYAMHATLYSTVLEDTVQDCLEKLNLTVFMDELERTDLEPILSSPDVRLTVFAPSDAAFNSLTNLMRLELLPDDSVNTTLAAHIAGCPYSGSRLSHGSILMTLAEDRCLHVTETDFYKFYKRISEVCITISFIYQHC